MSEGLLAKLEVEQGLPEQLSNGTIRNRLIPSLRGHQSSQIYYLMRRITNLEVNKNRYQSCQYWNGYYLCAGKPSAKNGDKA